MNGRATAVTTFRDELVLAGGFTQAGAISASRVVRWDGLDYKALGSGVNGEVSAVGVFGDNLIVAGSFNAAGGNPANSIARWDGTDWYPLAQGITGQIRALAVHGPDLIAAGKFQLAGSALAANIARWNGSEWSPLDSGLTGNDATVLSLASYQGELVAGGWFSSAGGASVQNVARWNGKYWTPFASGLAGGVGALTIFNGELFAATWQVYRWDGVSWQSTHLPDGDGIRALFPYQSELFAIGEDYFFRWNGATWSGSFSYFHRDGRMAEYHGELIFSDAFNTGSTAGAWGRFGPAEPQFVQQPSSSAVRTGAAATFRAAAIGNADLSYQWRRNSADLANGPNISGAQFPILTINSATMADAGQYDCLVANKCGTATSATARLRVIGSAPTPPGLTLPVSPATMD